MKVEQKRINLIMKSSNEYKLKDKIKGNNTNPPILRVLYLCEDLLFGMS